MGSEEQTCQVGGSVDWLAIVVVSLFVALACVVILVAVAAGLLLIERGLVNAKTDSCENKS